MQTDAAEINQTASQLKHLYQKHTQTQTYYGPLPGTPEWAGSLAKVRLTGFWNNHWIFTSWMPFLPLNL